MIISIISGVVYGLGTPILFASLLFGLKTRILENDPVVSARYGFLFQNYHEPYFYFELVQILRRGIIAGLVAGTTEDNGLENLAVVFFFLLSIYIQVCFPSKKKIFSK